MKCKLKQNLNLTKDMSVMNEIPSSLSHLGDAWQAQTAYMYQGQL
jgi:hypothetical protein